MEKIICASCGATLTPNTTQAFLTCEYCDTTVPNAYYHESDAKAAAEPTLEEICVKALLEMGENEQLADADESCFGNPVPSSRSAREAMGIPEEDKVYLLLDHLTILGSIKEGFALTDSSIFDLIIQYHLENKKYNIVEINIVLYEYDQPLLGSQI